MLFFSPGPSAVWAATFNEKHPAGSWISRPAFHQSCSQDACRRAVNSCYHRGDTRSHLPLIDADEVMSMSLRALGQLAVLMIPALVSAATITVRKDGSGDYSVLQNALDAVANGDTILIGPGDFADPTTIALPGYSYPVVSYAVVRTPELTIIGSGAGITAIGPTNFEGGGVPNTPQGLTCDMADARLTIRNLTVGNCELGLVVRGVLTMSDCQVHNTNIGMYWLPSGSGGLLQRTRFTGTWALGSLGIGDGTAAPGGLVEDCSIPGTLQVRGVQGLTVRDCELGSVYLMLGATMNLSRCSTSASGPGVALASGAGGYCGVEDCVIRGASSALTVDPSAPGARFVVSNSRLEGGTGAILWARSGSGPCVIHSSDLVKGAGVAVRCDNSSASVVHDLTNNWWGTSSAAEIASWIVDNSDDPNIGSIVLYSPFAGQSVPTESTSWGELKASYR